MHLQVLPSCALVPFCGEIFAMKLAISVVFAFVSLSLAAQTQFINPDGLFKPPGYTHVVVARGGKTLYIAGQVGIDRSGKVVSSDFRAQATQAFENLKTALLAGGATFDDVVKINYFVRNYTTELRPIVREVRDKYVNKEHPPASTLVGVSALATDDLLLEVEAIAVVPDKPAAKK